MMQTALQTPDRYIKLNAESRVVDDAGFSWAKRPELCDLRENNVVAKRREFIQVRLAAFAATAPAWRNGNKFIDPESPSHLEPTRLMVLRR
jgi:hypothetical protein